MLTLDKIKAAHGEKVFTVGVPEWDGDVFVKRMSAADYIWINSGEEAGTKAEQDVEFMIRICKRLMVNEDGSQLIADDDDYLLRDNPLLVIRVGKEILAKHKLGESVKKNSETTPPNDLPTDSA